MYSKISERYHSDPKLFCKQAKGSNLRESSCLFSCSTFFLLCANFYTVLKRFWLSFFLLIRQAGLLPVPFKKVQFERKSSNLFFVPIMQWHVAVLLSRKKKSTSNFWLVLVNKILAETKTCCCRNYHSPSFVVKKQE